MFELSLSLAFALVVFATSLHLIQESTERIEKGFNFQKYQQHALVSLLKINQLNNMNATSEFKFNDSFKLQPFKLKYYYSKSLFL